MLENENKILICFYSNQYANNIFASCFNIDENYTLYGQTINYTCSYEWGAEAFIISSIIKNQNKFFVCLANQIIFCTIYDNNEKKFGNWSEVKYDKLYKEMIQLYYFEENQKIILFYINIQPFSFNNQGKLEQNGTCSCPNTYTKAYSYYFLNYDNSSKTYHLISNHDVVYNCSINISVIPNFIELNSNENEKIPTMEIGSNQITNTLSMHSETVFVSTHLNRFHTSETIFFTSNNKYDTTTISTLSTKIINSISTTSLLINESSIKTYNINTITSNIFSDSILAGETYTNKNNISTTSIKITNNISTDSLQSIIKTDNINTMTNFIFTDSLLTEETSTNTNSTYIRPVNPTTINSIILLENFNITKENILKEIQSIAENIEIGKTYKKEEEDFSLYIYPTNSTFLTSVTHVNFSECESILRKHYKMPDTSIMTFFQIELKNDDSTSLINQVEYQAYYNNTFLDLSLCNNTNIKVYYSIKDNSLIDFSSVASFKDSGIDIFNINDSFFNDICHPYSNGEDDLILKDRIKDIYLNYSLCEQGCTYNEVDLDYMTIACDCQVKDSISTVVSPLNLDNIIETPSNFEIIKCYNLVFSWDGKLNNIGFWIFLLLVLLQGPLLMYYFCKGIKLIRTYIKDEMIKYGYIKGNKKKRIKTIKNSGKKGKKLGKNANKKIKSSSNKSNKKSTKSTKSAPPKNKKNKVVLKGKNKRINNKINNKMDDKSSSINNLKSTFNSEIIREINSEKKNKKNKITKYNKTKKISNKTKNKANLLTQAFDEIPNEKTKENNKNINKYFLININLNLSRNKKYVPPDSHIILNNYTFKEAVKYDLRHLCVIFYIFILSKQILFHTFLYRSPIELFSIRLSLFIFIFSSDLALNAFFYFNNNISKKYKANKNLFLFTFTDNITIILITTLCVFIFLTLIAKLSNSVYDIREVFMKEEEKLIKDKKYTVTEKRKKEILLEVETILNKYKTKITILVILEIIIMMFYWYYVIAFCHVYSSTQISWILDSLLSMLSRAIIEMLVSFLLAKLYRIAVESENHCLYRFAMFLYNFS